MGDFDGHTPGPWVPNIEAPMSVRHFNNGVVAKLCFIERAHAGARIRDYKEVCANARLIAAAPDLLAERDRLRAEVERLRGHIQDALGTLELWEPYPQPCTQRTRAALAQEPTP